MPFRLNPADRTCVQVQRPAGWRRVKCHPTQRQARSHLTALRINVIESVEAWAMIAEAEFDSKTPPVSRRKLGKSVNEKLMEANLRHRHLLLMIENGIAADVAKAYREALAIIETQIRILAERGGATENLVRLRQRSLERLQARIDEVLQVGDAAARQAVAEGLEKIATSEVAFQLSLMDKLFPAGIKVDLASPDEALIRLLLQEPLGGEVWAARFEKNHRRSLAAMRQSLAQSAALGEGADAAARRLVTQVKNLSLNRAITITRSEIQRVANRSAQEAYEANAGPGGVVKGIEVFETLDSRTCLVCILQDGKFFPAGAPTGVLPPYHANCRGFISPVTKSWSELGINRTDLSPSTRASMNGQVPAPVKYPEWFETQDKAFQLEVLGPSRFELFKAGQLPLDQMVKNNRIIPVSALPSLN